MTRVFIDSSVFFSAAYSSRGHARDLILMALGGEIDLVLSWIVIEETRRNLLESAPESVPFMEFVLQSVTHEIIRPSREQVIAAGKYTALKDAAIAAAAREAAVELLVTLDRKHLLGRPDLARHVGADIVTPQEAVRRLKQREGE
jgi:predicted nucleic acid-binding protein